MTTLEFSSFIKKERKKHKSGYTTLIKQSACSLRSEVNFKFYIIYVVNKKFY